MGRSRTTPEEPYRPTVWDRRLAARAKIARQHGRTATLYGSAMRRDAEITEIQAGLAECWVVRALGQPFSGVLPDIDPGCDCRICGGKYGVEVRANVTKFATQLDLVGAKRGQAWTNIYVAVRAPWRGPDRYAWVTPRDEKRALQEMWIAGWAWQSEFARHPKVQLLSGLCAAVPYDHLRPFAELMQMAGTLVKQEGMDL